MRTLVPLDEDTILESVKRTGRLVVVDECPLRCGIASEVSASVAEHGFDLLEGADRARHPRACAGALQPAAGGGDHARSGQDRRRRAQAAEQRLKRGQTGLFGVDRPPAPLYMEAARRADRPAAAPAPQDLSASARRTEPSKDYTTAITIWLAPAGEDAQMWARAEI